MPICKQRSEQRITPKKYQPQNYSLSSNSFHTKAPANQKPNEVTIHNYHPLQKKFSYYYLLLLAKWKNLTSSLSLFSWINERVRLSLWRCWQNNTYGVEYGKVSIWWCRVAFVVVFSLSLSVCCFCNISLSACSGESLEQATIWETFYLFNLMHILFTCPARISLPSYWIAIILPVAVDKWANLFGISSVGSIDGTGQTGMVDNIYEFPTIWNWVLSLFGYVFYAIFRSWLYKHSICYVSFRVTF